MYQIDIYAYFCIYIKRHLKMLFPHFYFKVDIHHNILLINITTCKTQLKKYRDDWTLLMSKLPFFGSFLKTSNERSLFLCFKTLKI